MVVPEDGGPAHCEGPGTHQKETGGVACFSRNLHLLEEASQAQRSQVFFQLKE